MNARVRLAAITIGVALAAAACGGGKSESPAAAPAAKQAATSFETMLGELPDDEALQQRLVFGDLARLRRAYPEPGAFAAALAAVRLPDALAGATRAPWIRRYGFGLGNVQRFVAGGFHPLELTVADGRFDAAVIRRQLGRAGYRRHGVLLQQGADGSVDRTAAIGRLALSSLDRLEVRDDRLLAASTTALARAGLAGKTALASNADLRLAAHALGPVTAAAVLPRELVPQPSAESAAKLATRRASFLGVGIDDGGPAQHTIRIVLVYPSTADAQADRARLASKLAATALPSRHGTTFGEMLKGLAFTTSGGRVLVVSAHVEDASEWRRLLADGDLAVLVIPASAAG